MRIFIGFDDTDTVDSDRGTGKLARWLEDKLPGGYRLWGVVRQQLLVDDAIPYTTHNSSACAIVKGPDSPSMDELISRAVVHIEQHFIPGSDPGLCIVPEGTVSLCRPDSVEARRRRSCSRLWRVLLPIVSESPLSRPKRCATA